ncbi:MAG TPA: DUF6328 family protein [Trebonia sp.]
MPRTSQLPPAEAGIEAERGRPAPVSVSAPPAEAAPVTGGHCQTCTSDGHDQWNAGARGETPLQRADRAYGEILQEVRVAQTGVQILFAFLLALAFQARFASITDFQRGTYAVTLMLCAAATALLIAPAAFHRVVYRMRLKLHLVQAASRLALSGLTLLMLSMVSAVLLILDFVFGTGPAVIMAAATLSWFLAWWFLVPVWCRIRHVAARSAGAVGDPGD